MNKYQEVLDKVKDDIEFAYERLFGIKPLPKSREQELNLLQELVDKETPKKPGYFNGYRECPNCCSELEHTRSYCEDCGQSLDWSGGDDK